VSFLIIYPILSFSLSVNLVEATSIGSHPGLEAPSTERRIRADLKDETVGEDHLKLGGHRRN
jgi:hypothetical protein